MGMQAEILVIGPYKVLKEADVLTYPDSFYKGVYPGDIVVGQVAAVNATSHSEILAELCDVKPWDLSHHRILHPMDRKSRPNDWMAICEELGTGYAADIFDKLTLLCSVRQCQVWYLPNG